MASSLPQRESRNIERAGFTYEQRVLLLEQDEDKNDRRHAELLETMAAVKNRTTALIITASSATLVGALNLVFGRLGG